MHNYHIDGGTGLIFNFGAFIQFQKYYSHLLNTSLVRDNSQGRVKVENQGLNSCQGWEKEKT